MKTKSLVLLTMMLTGFLLYSLLGARLFALLDLNDETDRFLVSKWVFAVLLLGIVVYRGEVRASGLVARANWRTLPLYWPFALILTLIWLGSSGLPTPSQALKILLLSIAVGFSEELMFRGLVFHWFRSANVRSIILISALAFGSVHLIGLATEIQPAVVLAQAFFAFSFGLIFACARARDTSIVLPIAMHALFDWLAISASGTVSQTFDDGQQLVAGMLVTGSIAAAWGLVLLKRAAPDRWELAEGSDERLPLELQASMATPENEGL